MAEALGIIATLFVILYFSRKQTQSLSVDIQTKVGEKCFKMVERLLQQKIKQKNHSTQIPGTATFLNR
jgi:uncharacterized BrkB/YihY/UPF0761 family membrane protein